MYYGHMHRAVRRGDSATLSLIEKGFDEISPGEKKALEDKWFGAPLAGERWLHAIVVAAARARAGGRHRGAVGPGAAARGAREDRRDRQPGAAPAHADRHAARPRLVQGPGRPLPGVQRALRALHRRARERAAGTSGQRVPAGRRRRRIRRRRPARDRGARAGAAPVHADLRARRPPGAGRVAAHAGVRLARRAHRRAEHRPRRHAAARRRAPPAPPQPPLPGAHQRARGHRARARARAAVRRGLPDHGARRRPAHGLDRPARPRGRRAGARRLGRQDRHLPRPAARLAGRRPARARAQRAGVPRRPRDALHRHRHRPRHGHLARGRAGARLPVVVGVSAEVARPHGGRVHDVLVGDPVLRRRRARAAGAAVGGHRPRARGLRAGRGARARRDRRCATARRASRRCSA